jgi:small subunit ribosomal protein S9
VSDEDKQEQTSEEPQAEEIQPEGAQEEAPEVEAADETAAEETPAEATEDSPADPEREAEGDTQDSPADPEREAEEDTSETSAEGGGTSEEPSNSEDSATSEEVTETEQGSEDPPAADAKRSKPAESEKKDVIPGADLEPIAVEADQRPLSAEERARLEAEEEERASREAELVGGAEEEPSAASRAPAKMESGARYQATGKRKRSIARVTLLPGDGKIEINKRDLEEFFPRPLHQTMARQPLTATGYEGSVDVRVRVHGGGIGGQAGAVRHGIARALTEIDPELRGELKRRGFLTRDARVKERRKAGLKKARKRPQFSKR